MPSLTKCWDSSSFLKPDDQFNSESPAYPLLQKAQDSVTLNTAESVEINFLELGNNWGSSQLQDDCSTSGSHVNSALGKTQASVPFCETQAQIMSDDLQDLFQEVSPDGTQTQNIAYALQEKMQGHYQGQMQASTSIKQTPILFELQEQPQKNCELMEVCPQEQPQGLYQAIEVSKCEQSQDCSQQMKVSLGSTQIHSNVCELQTQLQYYPQLMEASLCETQVESIVCEQQTQIQGYPKLMEGMEGEKQVQSTFDQLQTQPQGYPKPMEVYCGGALAQSNVGECQEDPKGKYYLLRLSPNKMQAQSIIKEIQDQSQVCFQLVDISSSGTKAQNNTFKLQEQSKDCYQLMKIPPIANALHISAGSSHEAHCFIEEKSGSRRPPKDEKNAARCKRYRGKKKKENELRDKEYEKELNKNRMLNQRLMGITKEVKDLYERIFGPYYTALRSTGDEEKFTSSFKMVCDVFQELEKEISTRGTTFFCGSEPGMLDYMLWPWFERFPVLKVMRPKTEFPSTPKLTSWQAAMWKTDAVSRYGLDVETQARFYAEYAKPDSQCNYDMLLQPSA